MNLPSRRAIVVISVVLLTTSFVRAQEFADPCAVAAVPAVYPAGAKSVTAPMRTAIAKYKSDWVQLCSTKKGKTLAQLLDDGTAIVSTLETVLFPVDSKTPPESREAFVQSLGAFIPGVYGDLGESAGVRTWLPAFAKRKDLGSAEDRMFLSQWSALALDGYMSPWLQQTWDYGGCLKFGEYDWRTTIGGIERLQSQIHEPAYKKLLDGRESSLLEDVRADPSGFENTNPICTCNAKSDVPKDLQQIRSVLSASARYRKYLGPLDTLLKKIAAKQIEVKSEAEAHCSGG